MQRIDFEFIFHCLWVIYFGPGFVCLTGLVSVLRACACGLNDSADLECHTLLFWLTHSISLTSNMQPARRSSRLLKLKDVESDPPRVSETAPMNSPDIPLGSCPSSRKRHRRRGSAGDTSPPPEHIEPEVESLLDEEFSDDNPDDAPVAADTPENRSKEQRVGVCITLKLSSIQSCCDHKESQ